MPKQPPKGKILSPSQLYIARENKAVEQERKRSKAPPARLDPASFSIPVEKKPIKVLKAEVVERPGSTDYIVLTIDMPSTFPPGVGNPNLVLKTEAVKGSGAKYVRKHFGIEPEVIVTP